MDAPNSRLAVPKQPITAPSSATNSTADLPATAGFDFKKISDVLGKNVDPEVVKLPQPSIVVPDSVRHLRERAPLERAESAPPLDQDADPVSELDTRSASPLTSANPASRSATSAPDEEIGSMQPSAQAEAPDFSNEWASSAAPKASFASQTASTRAARGFPSHVLQSATNIFSKDLDMPSHFDADVNGDDDDEGGDIGGFGRESKDATTGWSTYPDRKPKDDWALNNPW